MPTLFGRIHKRQNCRTATSANNNTKTQFWARTVLRVGMWWGGVGACAQKKQNNNDGAKKKTRLGNLKL